MLSDGFRSVASLVAGAALLLLGAAVPVHFRGLDETVLEAAGAGTGTVLDAAGRMVDAQRVGAARLLIEVGRSHSPAGAASVEEGIKVVTEAGRAWAGRWGGPAPWMEQRVGRWVGGVGEPADGRLPVMAWILRVEVRDALRRALSSSTDPAVSELLACRELEKTVIMPAVRSAAGQPMEAALLGVASMVASGRMDPKLALDFEQAATAARTGKGSERLEAGLLDFLGAARQLDWEQLASVCGVCPDLRSLHALVAGAGVDGVHWPVLFAASVLDGGDAGRVATLLNRGGAGAVADLGKALFWGEGAVKEFLVRGERLRTRGMIRLPYPEIGRMVMRAPQVALVAKYLLWLDGVFLVFLGLNWAWQATRSPTLLASDPRPDYGVLAVLTATVGIILFLVSERYLFDKSSGPLTASSVSVPTLRLRLRAEIPHVTNPAMNGKILVMLVVFFVIQFCIYVVGLSRLRHVRGQMVDDGIKLRLLDNEESMFDAPLYLGIGGSVLALVLRLTGFDEVSLMASYSSTLFGILFCFLLKVVHVRPYRQQLILESAAREQS